MKRPKMRVERSVPQDEWAGCLLGSQSEAVDVPFSSRHVCANRREAWSATMVAWGMLQRAIGNPVVREGCWRRWTPFVPRAHCRLGWSPAATTVIERPGGLCALENRATHCACLAGLRREEMCTELRSAPMVRWGSAGIEDQERSPCWALAVLRLAPM
jgi:hypothetical protein